MIFIFLIKTGGIYIKKIDNLKSPKNTTKQNNLISPTVQNKRRKSLLIKRNIHGRHETNEDLQKIFSHLIQVYKQK